LILNIDCVNDNILIIYASRKVALLSIPMHSRFHPTRLLLVLLPSISYFLFSVAGTGGAATSGWCT